MPRIKHGSLCLPSTCGYRMYFNPSGGRNEPCILISLLHLIISWTGLNAAALMKMHRHIPGSLGTRIHFCLIVFFLGGLDRHSLNWYLEGAAGQRTSVAPTFATAFVAVWPIRLSLGWTRLVSKGPPPPRTAQRRGILSGDSSPAMSWVTDISWMDHVQSILMITETSSHWMQVLLSRDPETSWAQGISLFISHLPKVKKKNPLFKVTYNSFPFLRQLTTVKLLKQNNRSQCGVVV